MAILVVKTLTLENYGIREWWGEEPGHAPQDWRPQSKNIYIINNVSPTIDDERSIIMSLENHLHVNNDSTQVIITDYAMHEEDTPYYYYYDKDAGYGAPIVLTNSCRLTHTPAGTTISRIWRAQRKTMREHLELPSYIDHLFETWVLKEEGRKIKYKSFYKYLNGETKQSLN
jgi:hypothetical protein